MGTLAAGIKDIFSAAKTTGSNVMLCGNDGTPDGHMTMANLANVLGAFRSLGTIVDSSDDLSSHMTTGSWDIRLCGASCGGGAGVLLVFRETSICAQLLLNETDGTENVAQCHVRITEPWHDTFGAWVKL